MTDKVRVGVIGCGAIAQEAHLPGYAACKDAEIVAVCDIDEARAKEVAAKHKVARVYSNHQALLADESIQAVSVCTPNNLHAMQVVDALRAGKHVLSEKPMATSRADAQAMLDATAETGKLLMVGFTHRFVRVNRYMRKLIQTGAIGRVVSIRVRFAHHGPYDSWVAKTDWFFRHEMAGGGATLDMGIHALDIMRFLNGEIAEIKGMLATQVHRIKDEDTALMLLRFENGSLGYIETGWHSCDGGFTGIEVYGTQGSMINRYGQDLLILDAAGKAQPVDANELAGDDSHLFEMRHWVECVKKGVQPEVGGLDGYKAVDLALRLYEE